VCLSSVTNRLRDRQFVRGVRGTPRSFRAPTVIPAVTAAEISLARGSPQKAAEDGPLAAVITEFDHACPRAAWAGNLGWETCFFVL
jgi:hypothetical protein